MFEFRLWKSHPTGKFQNYLHFSISVNCDDQCVNFSFFFFCENIMIFGNLMLFSWKNYNLGWWIKKKEKNTRGHPGSNQGPLDLQSNALPLSYAPRSTGECVKMCNKNLLYVALKLGNRFFHHGNDIYCLTTGIIIFFFCFV